MFEFFFFFRFVCFNYLGVFKLLYIIILSILFFRPFKIIRILKFVELSPKFGVRPKAVTQLGHV